MVNTERGGIRPVDIVVPVYNGYEDLRACLESLRKYTDLSLHRLILIDDRSPDERIRPWLESQGKVPGIKVIFNEKNKGFSANVNTGLACSDRDTILLNSDTRVTEGWVEKLQRCAYSSVRIATVTPLSNAATLASVPEFLRDNTLPEGFTVEEYGELVGRVSLRTYPRITVGVGFCLYVKDEAYRAAGKFDEATFGRGYGEENDFCNRLGMLGYIHVLCDDTFIYHRGTASFDTEEKRKLCEEHDRILRSRYPAQMEENDAYCRENPDKGIRDNLKLYTKLANGRKNLLYVLHLDFQGIAKDHIGGTQLHVRDLVKGARKDFNVFVIARDGENLRLTIYPRGEEGQEFLKFPIGKKEAFPVFHDEHMAKILRQILTVFDIDLVHVHHTEGLTLDIFDVCGDLKIPVICTLHDYYYACPTVKLLDREGGFCPESGHFAPADDRICRKCLHRTCGYGHVSVIDRWRAENGKALSKCGRIIFPSESAEKVMLSAFPFLAEKSIVVPHGNSLAGEEGCRKADIVRGPAAHVEKTGRMHSCLDRLPGRDGSFSYLTGWAYLEGEDNRKFSAYAEVTDRKGGIYLLPVRKVPRRDVADQTADSRCLYSGFHSVFDIPDMSEGRFRMRVLLEKDGIFYTDGKIRQGVFGKPDSSAAGSGLTGRIFGKEKTLNVAFLGGVTRAKGSKVLSEIIRSKAPGMRFFVFGQVGDPEVLSEGTPDGVSFSGVYEQEDIGRLLSAAGIDLALILPVWGETFCYTVSEAWSAGVPVLGTDIGAVGERIRKTGAGWLVSPAASAEDVLALLERIRNDPDELKEKKKAAAALKLKTVSWMNAEYRILYGDLLGGGRAKKADKIRHRNSHPDDLRAVFDGYALANPSVKGKGTEAEKNRLREENETLRASIDMMKNTISYRFARKIADADLPGKETLKKVLRKKDHA